MTDQIGRRDFLIASTATVALPTTLSVALGSETGPAASRIHAVNLKVDHADCPRGIENRTPRLSWQLESSARNSRQAAYRVLVSSSKEKLEANIGDIWDSGKKQSSRSLGIQYDGTKLRSRQLCWWGVQVWDANDSAPKKSDASWWEMGLLEEADWTAAWLAAEDPVAKGDREAGLRWIWGDSQEEEGSRKFRSSFVLPVASSLGELIVVVSDWFWLIQITRIWIDGSAIAGPGAWVDNTDVGDVNPVDLSRRCITLPPLNFGEHFIAIEVNTRKFLSRLDENQFPPSTYRPAMAAMIRLSTTESDSVRVGTAENWKTSTGQHLNWYAPEYNDSAWANARFVPIDGYQPWPPRPAVHMRHAFFLHKIPIAARLYATALGAYEARLNGKRVGDALLTPEPSQYAKRVLYRVYDVCEALQPGLNVLGLTVGDGWYASFDGRFAWAPPPRRAIAQLEITFSDGSCQSVATGPEWYYSISPIQSSEIKVGEIHDARMEQSGWDMPQFRPIGWQPAESAPKPTCQLVAQLTPPIRATRVLSPTSISEPKPGEYVVDFGQHFTGWCQLRVHGQRGTRIEVRYADLLNSSGALDQSNQILSVTTTGKMYDPSGGRKLDIFILKGDPLGETLAPLFVYRGFRYIQISGLTTAPCNQSVQGLFIHSDLAITGIFRSATPLIEDISHIILQTQLSTFTGIPTDNAVREFRGWMGDAAIFWDTAAFNMDICTFTSRQMDNASDDQTDDGAFPNLTPIPKHNNALHYARGAAPGWGDAGIILPWTAWNRYGDTDIVERHWDGMNRYLSYILRNNSNFLWKYHRSYDYADWLGSDRSTLRELIGTAYWAHSADLLSQMASAIQRNSDAARLRQVYEQVRKAFNAEFVKRDGAIGSGSQTSYVLALKFGLLQGEAVSRAGERLAADIRSRGPALTTGILGTQFVLDVLADCGFADLAYDLLLKVDHPSWGYMIRNGATSIWESWDGRGARNQYALGSIGGFLFRRVAGIDVGAPGFEKVVIRPLIDARIKSSGAHYRSVAGLISTEWKQHSNTSVELRVTIPPNTTAVVHMPARNTHAVREGRRNILSRTDIKIISRTEKAVVMEIGSGSYSFFVEE